MLKWTCICVDRMLVENATTIADLLGKELLLYYAFLNPFPPRPTKTNPFTILLCLNFIYSFIKFLF